MAKQNNIKKNIRRLKILHRELANLGPLMRGSVFVQGSPNRLLFSFNKDGKTHLLYLGKSRETRAREYSSNYKKLLEIVEEMTIINMQLLKEQVKEEEILPPQNKLRARFSIWENR
jgi:hypothetical protein